MTPIRAQLPDGRWHFQHGPIDVILGADGDALPIAAAHEEAWLRFRAILSELVIELPVLRRPINEPCPLAGEIARNMWAACHPYRDFFITPMAAVAGAVADALIGFYRRVGIRRAHVNNGGDIALYLGEGEAIDIGIFADLSRFDAGMLAAELPLDGRFTISHAMPVRGVATSGWRGRSFSLGIADSVTVLAATGAKADAAATRIANAVDCRHPTIERAPANSIKDDTDLGDIPVTTFVPTLPLADLEQAVLAGLAEAQRLQACGLIDAAFIACQGVIATTDDVFDRNRGLARAAAIHWNEECR